MDRSTVWHENLERRRQPALYYLSSQEDSAGPHLICDWNGAPATFRKLGVDILRELTATSVQPSKHTIPSKTCASEQPLKQTTSSYSVLTQDDGSSFDFLTVPPVPVGILKKLIKRTKQPDNSCNLAEESEVPSSSSSSSSTSAPTSASSNGTSQAPLKRKLTRAPSNKRISRKLRTRILQHASNAKR